MKNIKISALCLSIGILLSSICASAAGDRDTQISFTIGSSEIQINGKTLQTEPSFTKDDSTLVPVRVITEAFGADVGWNDQDQSVSIRLGDESLLLVAGERSCMVGNEPKTLPTAPVLVHDTTMVPLRFISETFGALVDYDATTGRVTVLYSPAPQGTRVQQPAFGMQLVMPQGWKQVSSSAERLLLEKHYMDGSRAFVLAEAIQTDCDAQEWLKQETAFLQAQYGKEHFTSQSGTYTDANGGWTTLSATADFSTWQTHLRERYLPGSEFSYFIRYGRLTPSPQDTAGSGDTLAKEIAARGAGSQIPAGAEPAWTEMETILDTLSVSEPTQSAVLASIPDWKQTQTILNKYDGWHMDLPKSFETLIMEENRTLFEQKTDGVRLAVVTSNKAATISFTNIVPIQIKLRRGVQVPFKNFSEAFVNKTMHDLKDTGNYIHGEGIEFPPGKKDSIDTSVYRKNTLCIQKDTVRFFSLNYFFHTIIQAQLLEPEETSHWLAMEKLYDSLHTFHYSRLDGAPFQG